MAFNLVYLSQQDPQWKNDTLGFASDPKDTIGYVGCALTSVSMLLSGYGFKETPQTLNQKLKAKQGFVDSGIRWDVVHQVHPEVALKSNVRCENTDAPLEQIDSWLAAGHPVVVRVDASPNPGLQWHYVLVYGHEGDDYLMLDPWPYKPGTATKDYLMKRYSQGRPLRHAIQQVLFYEVAGSSGPITTPSSTTTTTPTGTPQTQPTSAPTPSSGVYARVMDSVTWGLNIRSSTDTSSMDNLVLAVPAGTQLVLLDANDAAKIGKKDKWIRVREPGGKEGFCAAWYLEPVAVAAPAPAPVPVPSPANEPPASTTSTPVPPVATTNTPSTSSTSTPMPAPEPKKIQVIVKANNTKIYSTATSSAVISVEKAGTRLTVVEPADGAKAKIGVKGQKINVKATNNKRGFVSGDSVRAA
jgi:hypothetical protein